MMKESKQQEMGSENQFTTSKVVCGGGKLKARQSPSTPRSGSQECNIAVTRAICSTAGGAAEDDGTEALIRR